MRRIAAHPPPATDRWRGPAIAERLLGTGTLVGPPPHPCEKSPAAEQDGYYSDVGFSGLTAHSWLRLVPEQVVDAFLAPGSCLVVGDAPGDPDCFCSAASWARGRRAVGRSAEAHVAAPPPKSIRHLFKEAELVDAAKVSAARYDTVVLVDNDGKRIGAAATAAMQQARRVVVVDHHEVAPTHESLGLAPDAELVVWKISGADAAALMTFATVLRGVERAEACLTPAGWRDVLEPVLAGLYSDTRGFTAGRASRGTMGLLRSVLQSHALDVDWVLGRFGDAVPREHLLSLWGALELRTEEHHGQELTLFKLDGRTLLSTLEKARRIEPELTWSDLYFATLDYVEAHAKCTGSAATILALETPAEARAELSGELQKQLPPARTKFSIRSVSPMLAVKMAQAMGGNGKPGEAGGGSAEGAEEVLAAASSFMRTAAQKQAALRHEARLRCRGSI